MTEKIKDIVNQFLKDRTEYQISYKYKLNHSYYVKFEKLTSYDIDGSTDFVRVYLGVELPGYEYVTSDTYKFTPYRLSSDDEGLAALILMQYKETEKKHKDSISIGYNCYKSVVSENERLRDEIEHLKKEVENWKQTSIENHNSYLLEKKRYEEYHDKYFEEKLNHTQTESRIVFAQHILSGNREDRVKDFWDNHKEYVDMYKFNENKY